MSTDLDRALADVAGHLDDIAPPITAEEILAAHNGADSSESIVLTRTSRARPRTSRTLAVAAGIAVLVTGLVAVAALRDSSTASDQPDVSPPPRPDDLPATGVLVAPEDSLALASAQHALIAECMAEKGFEYPEPTTDELIAGFGEWQPHAVLGIQRAGAARRIGYHSSGVGGFGTASQANAINLMDAGRREAFGIALEGPEVAVATMPDQVAEHASGRVRAGGCLGDAQSALGNSLDRDEQLRAAVNDAAEIGDGAPSGSGFDDAALDDPRVEDALSTWAMCVEWSTGEQAAMPDELARRFLDGNDDGNDDGSATSREIAVATVDAECQKRAHLWTTWYTVVAELTRDKLGNDAHRYDDWTRIRVEMVEAARSILAEREIDLPSLD